MDSRPAQRCDQHPVPFKPEDTVLRGHPSVLQAEVTLRGVAADQQAAAHFAGPAGFGHHTPGTQVERQPAGRQRIGRFIGRCQQMLGFGLLFRRAVLPALPGAAPGQRHQQYAEQQHRQPEAFPVKPAVRRVAADREGHGSTAVAEVGRGDPACNLVQLQGIVPVVERGDGQGSGAAVLAQNDRAYGRRPAPDIGAAQPVAAGAVGVANRLVEGQGQCIPAGQCHRFHRRGGELVSHIDGGRSLHGGAKAWHRNGQGIKPLPCKGCGKFGFELKHVGKRSLGLAQRIGQAFGFGCHNLSPAHAGQRRGQGALRAGRKSPDCHIQPRCCIACQAGQQRRV